MTTASTTETTPRPSLALRARRRRGAGRLRGGGAAARRPTRERCGRRNRPLRSSGEHWIVDGSALTGSTVDVPALLSAIVALRAAAGGRAVTVIVDARTLHRVSPAQRARLTGAMLAGEFVVPPAGCVGGTAQFAQAVAAHVPPDLGSGPGVMYRSMGIWA